jgi:Tfp pilus assembly protein PilX
MKTIAMQSIKQQRGISLVMALIMLIVLTLTAISSTSSVNSGIRIAGNMQIQDEVLTAAQMAIDDQLSSLANFTAAVDREIDVDINRDGTNDYRVKLFAPVCTSTAPAQQDSYKLSNSSPNKTFWEVRTEVTDISTSTGATATVYQGVRINLLPSMGC